MVGSSAWTDLIMCVVRVGGVFWFWVGGGWFFERIWLGFNPIEA